jgi:prolipoprotein diacylglyceryltransferase
VSVIGFIPSPPENGFHLGPLFFHSYGLLYAVAVAAAIRITVRRWQAVGGQASLVQEVPVWAFPAGLVGARLRDHLRDHAAHGEA